MSSVTLLCGTFCYGDEVAHKTARALGFELIQDQDIISEVSKHLEMPEDRIRAALLGETSFYNRFSHDRERALASLKLALSEKLIRDRLLFLGFVGLLIPRDITHVLRIGIIAETKYRLQRAIQEKGLTHERAIKRIRQDDDKAHSWTSYLFNKKTWDSALYDMIIPMDKKNVDEAVELIQKNIKKDVVQKTPSSGRSVDDFALASKVESVLAGEGKDVSVTSRDGHVTLTINKHVIRLSRMKEKLRKLTMEVQGVTGIDTKVGPGYHKSDVYRKFDLKGPSKVVLVDDEREYVETLSERLQMRDMGTNIVYDGKEALSVLDEEEPEVMVLDLKMPGIDGMEVLRHIKEEHSKVEVIVMTGQGSEEDKESCMKLGAFAYLEKPVDVEVLAQIMRKAYQKAKGEGQDVSDK
jgi:two-component system response regulator CpxR